MVDVTSLRVKYPCIENNFSYSNGEWGKLLENSKISKKLNFLDKFRFPGLYEKITPDPLSVLDISLGFLSKIYAFVEKKKNFRDRLLTEFEETLTEIVVGGLLIENNISINTFGYKYQYESNKKENQKDFDICAMIEGRKVFFEITTKREYKYSKLKGYIGLDEMVIKNIKNKYKDKKIAHAYKLGFLNDDPIIIVANNVRTQPHGILSEAIQEKYLKDCKLLHSFSIFSGYRIVNGSVRLYQCNIYPNPYRNNLVESVEIKKAFKKYEKWMVDATYDDILL